LANVDNKAFKLTHRHSSKLVLFYYEILYGIIHMSATSDRVLELRITGEINGKPLSPDTVSMEMFVAFVNETKDFILGSAGSKAERDLFLKEAHFAIQEGSLKSRIGIPVLLATSAIATSLEADIKTLSSGSLDIDPKRAGMIQDVGKRLQRNELSTLNIKGTGFKGKPLNIDIDKSTKWAQPHSFLVTVEEYVKAAIENMGGISPNVHLRFEDGDSVIASASEAYLKDLDKNFLYKDVIAHVTYKHNPQTKRNSNYYLHSITESPASLDMEAFERAVEAGTKLWQDVPDPVAWVRSIRGASDE
jgi:hypothetical protein